MASKRVRDDDAGDARGKLSRKDGSGGGAGGPPLSAENGAATAVPKSPTENEIVVYWGSGSPPAWRCTSCLIEKKIPHRSELVSFESGVLKTAPFRALNPRSLVPILTDGDVRIYESLAILDYLEHFYTDVPLLPKDKPQRAVALTRVQEANNLSVVAGEVIYYVRRTPPEDINHEYLAVKRQTMLDEVALWEMYLTGSVYLVGAQFTLADISFFPQLAYIVRLGLELSPKFPNLSRYYEHLKRRPCFADSWPPHWKESPGLPLLAERPEPASS